MKGDHAFSRGCRGKRAETREKLMQMTARGDIFVFYIIRAFISP